MPGSRRATSTRSCSAISTRASRRRISPPRWCCRPRPDLRFKRATRVENACATGSAAVHQGLNSIEGEAGAHRAGGRCRADDDDAGPEIGKNLLEGVLCARRGQYRGRLRRHLRQDRRALFPEIRRPVRRAGDDRGQESTRTASAILMRRCARISASTSAAMRATRIPSSPGR